MSQLFQLKAALIDDEPAARDDLRRLLAAHPEIVVAGEAGRVAVAEEVLRAGGYDLVFLDVELRGGTGFDLLPHVRPEARVIFVTAHSHYAVRAFDINALDYLVKPISAARLAEALRRIALAPAVELPAPPTLVATDLVHLKVGNGTTRFVALADIAVIESDENYSSVRLANGAHLLVRRTLKAWEDYLPQGQFVRVHRTTIINLARYRGSDRPSDRTTMLHLDGVSEPIAASYRFLPELRERLAAIGREM